MHVPILKLAPSSAVSSRTWHTSWNTPVKAVSAAPSTDFGGQTRTSHFLSFGPQLSYSARAQPERNLQTQNACAFKEESVLFRERAASRIISHPVLHKTALSQPWRLAVPGAGGAGMERPRWPKADERRSCLLFGTEIPLLTTSLEAISVRWHLSHLWSWKITFWRCFLPFFTPCVTSPHLLQQPSWLWATAATDPF